MADLDDLDRLLALLGEHPERMEQLLAVLMPPAVRELAPAVNQLAGAQLGTEEHVSALADRVSDLTSHVAVLTDQLSGLAGHLSTLTDQVSGLAEHLSTLTDQLSGLAEHLSTLTGHVDWLRGDVIERRYRERPQTYLNAVARRMHLLTPRELDDLLDPAVDSGLLNVDEANQVRSADGVFEGRRVSDRADVYVVLEASFGVGLGDVTRAAERAALLAQVGVEAVAVVGGTWIAPEAAEAARSYGVWQVTNGRARAPAA